MRTRLSTLLDTGRAAPPQRRHRGAWALEQLFSGLAGCVSASLGKGVLGKITDARCHLHFYLNWSRMRPGPQDGLKSIPGDFNMQLGLKTTASERRRQTPWCTQMENTQFKNNSYPGPSPARKTSAAYQARRTARRIPVPRFIQTAPL